MKKIFISAFAVLAMLAMPQQVEAQAFLNKMKEKAQQAASNAASKMLEGTKAGEAMKSSQQSSSSSSNASIAIVDDSHYAETNEEVSTVDLSKKASSLQRQSTHVGNWDDALVTPSTAKFPIPLMNELPAVPSAQEIANPTEAAQKAYYMAIQKVSLRAQQLSKDETCDKEQEEMYNKQLKEKMMKAYGFTEREYKIFSGEIEGTEAEQQKVAEKMLGFNMDDMMAAFGDVENMTEAEREAKAKEMAGDMVGGSTNAASKVFNKYATELKKYTGKTAAETNQMMDQQTKLAMQGKEKEADAMSKKFEAEVKAYQKTLSAADQKAAKEFESKMQKEVQEAMMNASRNGGNPMMQMMAGMQEAQKKEQEIVALKKKQDDYREALGKAIPNYVYGANKDYEFSAAERKKVEAIRAKIVATDDPAVYNPLFAEANTIISTYRQRAAQAWRSDVEKRFNAIKTALPNMIKVNRQAIADQIIPECMLYRAPLNMVLKACETLEDAYTAVPADYPVLYEAEVVRQVKLNAGEQMWWPEFYVAETVSNILAGKTIFKSSNGQVYQFNAGKWVNANKKSSDKYIDNYAKMKSQKWTSSDGKRTVTYVEEGGYFLLPEGDIIQPRAIEKIGNNLVWAETVEEEDKQGNTVIKIVKYTYKL